MSVQTQTTFDKSTGTSLTARVKMNMSTSSTSSNHGLANYGSIYEAGRGVISTDYAGQYNNTAGQYRWDGNPFQFARTPENVSKVADLLKDTNTKEIILCKTREECKEKYGEYGLKYFDSVLAELLQTAIKSEELFNNQLQLERDNHENFRQAVCEKFGNTEEFKSIIVSCLEYDAK